MGQFEHVPAKQSALTGTNTMIQYTGEMRSLQLD
jgi:hypothetical protein